MPPDATGGDQTLTVQVIAGVQSAPAAISIWGNYVRRILHLSDLHIGMNNSQVPLRQAQRIVQGMIDTYAGDNPKPIVVISGDLVDYCSPDNCLAAQGLLDQLKTKGFTPLVVPGNHDYSDAVDAATGVSILQVPPHIGWLTTTIGGIMTKDFLDEAAKDGYDSHLTSGHSYVQALCDLWRSYFGAYMGNSFGKYGDSGRYDFYENWIKRGSKHDLDIILLDAQDHHPSGPNSTDYSNPMGIYTKFYFHDNTRQGNSVEADYLPSHMKGGVRFDMGWLEDKTDYGIKNDRYTTDTCGVNFLKKAIANALTNHSLPVVALHYPLYWYAPPPDPDPSNPIKASIWDFTAPALSTPKSPRKAASRSQTTLCSPRKPTVCRASRLRLSAVSAPVADSTCPSTISTPKAWSTAGTMRSINARARSLRANSSSPAMSTMESC